jgi:mRNA interferase MazF
MMTGKSTTKYHKGDVVLISFPFTDLTSMKTRPAVVISVNEYLKETGDYTVDMITSVRQTTPYDYELKDWKSARLLVPSWVRAKFVTLDPALVRYQPGKLSKQDMTEVDKIYARLWDYKKSKVNTIIIFLNSFALYYDLTVLINNHRHFERIAGLDIMSI